MSHWRCKVPKDRWREVKGFLRAKGCYHRGILQDHKLSVFGNETAANFAKRVSSTSYKGDGYRAVMSIMRRVYE